VSRPLAEPTAWTAADQAELDLHLWRVVDAVFGHRESCDTCRAGVEPCGYVRDAIGELVDWRRERILLSAAEHARLERTRELEEAGA
jgi:hypothetical protein